MDWGFQLELYFTLPGGTPRPLRGSARASEEQERRGGRGLIDLIRIALRGCGLRLPDTDSSTARSETFLLAAAVGKEKERELPKAPF